MPDDLASGALPQGFKGIDLQTAIPVTPGEAPIEPLTPVEPPTARQASNQEGSLNLQGAKAVAPQDVPIEKGLPPLDQAGVNLAIGVLCMIAGFVLIVVIWAWTSEASFFSDYSTRTTEVGTNAVAQATLDSFVKARTDFRDFWIKLVQMILLNVLLPVLTGLLGYVFGSRRAAAADATNKQN